MYPLVCVADLHNGSEFFNNGTVRVADTKVLAKVLAECAVGNEVVVLILVADILLAFLLAFLLALEQSAEPVEDTIGRLRLIVPLLQLTVRMRNAGRCE